MAGGYSAVRFLLQFHIRFLVRSKLRTHYKQTAESFRDMREETGKIQYVDFFLDKALYIV